VVDRVGAWLPPTPAPIDTLTRLPAQAREAGAAALHRLEREWRTRRDQMNAVMSFWSANSVVARKRRPARSTGKDDGSVTIGVGRR